MKNLSSSDILKSHLRKCSSCGDVEIYIERQSDGLALKCDHCGSVDVQLVEVIGKKSRYA